MDVSIVVTCKGRLADLARSLPSLLSQQTRRTYEIVVVDYEDPDGAFHFIRDLDHPRLSAVGVRAISRSTFNLSHARNAGASVAHGSALAFIDADVALSPDWIERAMAALEDPGVVLVRHEPAAEFITGQCLVRANVFHAVRGYDEGMPGWWGEDGDLYERVRKVGRFAFLPADYATATPHSDELRTRFYPIKDVRRSADEATRYLMSRSTVNPYGYGSGCYAYYCGGSGYHFPNAIENSINFESTPDTRPPLEYQPAHWKPVMSIITPFYNCGGVLERLAASVLNQTFTDWEWILVDDGSDDPLTVGSAAAVASLDPRIRLVTCPMNRGPGAARNTAADQAKGEIIVQVDGDDMMEPNALEMAYLALAYHYDRAIVGWQAIGFGARRYLWGTTLRLDPTLLHYNSGGSCFAVRREAWHAVRGYDESMRYAEDWEFLVRLAAAGFKTVTLPYPAWWYRTEPLDRWTEKYPQAKQTHRIVRHLEGLYGEKVRAEPDARLWPLGTRSANIIKRRGKHAIMIAPWFVTGGADKIGLDVAEILKGAGYGVTLVTTVHTCHNWLDAFSRVSPDVVHLEHVAPTAERQAEVLNYLIRSRGANLVINNNSAAGYDALEAMKAAHPNVRQAAILHMPEDGGYPEVSLLKQQHLDVVMPISDRLAHWLKVRGMAAEKIRPVHWSAKLSRFLGALLEREATRTSLGLESDEFAVLWAGRLVDQKDPLMLPAITARMPEGSNLKIMVAGDGELRGALEAEVDALGQAHRFKFLGDVAIDKMPATMAAADAFAMTSKFEGIPIVLYEAMASGLPTVSFDVGAVDELLAGGGMLIRRVNRRDLDVKAFARALHVLEISAEIRQRYTQAGRSKLETTFAYPVLERNVLAALGA